MWTYYRRVATIGGWTISKEPDCGPPSDQVGYFLHCGALSDCGHYRNVGTTTRSGQLLSPVWGTIGLWALSESWRTGARLAAVIEAVARLAAVIDWAWKAEIGLGKSGIGLGKLEFDPSSPFEFLQDLSARIAIVFRNSVHHRLQFSSDR